MKSYIIAGTNSGCGKTTVSLGLMAALSRRGLQVQPFKSGPDFIDPTHHSRAISTFGTQRTSQNLDSWMLPSQTVKEIFFNHTKDADIAIIEGVMGLYDGYSSTEDTGSTASLAKMLDAPVILVVNSSSMARSVAALISGYINFDPALRFAGIVLNQVGSDSHASILKEALKATLPHIPVLGAIRKNKALVTPSRHLGLTMAEEQNDSLYTALADCIEESLDLDLLIESELSANRVNSRPPARQHHTDLPVRIGIAKDEAFCFYYDENLRLLEEQGGELCFFSPIHDQKLPDGIQGIYIGGGYPELYAKKLEQNTSMRSAIKSFSDNNGVVYAECGGFMYLMDELTDTSDATYSMTGVFPFQCAMQKRFQALGYRQVTTQKRSLLGPEKTVIRGHEFHYSALTIPSHADIPDIYAMTGRKGVVETPEGFTIKNTLGSYVHMHFGSNPQVVHNILAACKTD
ncbi:MAG: cobyrinate a,c-diamide synthase [Desulfovibrio sp.]